MVVRLFHVGFWMRWMGLIGAGLGSLYALLHHIGLQNLLNVLRVLTTTLL